ncbi:MAG: TatD family hydrolase, partial [Desulfamplus sp.]|nr:TatD family hydrolase [Desulfamplus sp.]
VTHPANKKVKKSLKAVSPHRLLIETDSPAILPRYFTSKEFQSEK